MGPSERRWLIPDPGTRLDDKGYWEKEHCDLGYNSTFSVGEDEALTNAIVHEALSSSPCTDILIAGCGSRVDLQRALLSRAPSHTEVIATDYAAVIALARERFSHPRLTYAALESAAPFVQSFDVIIAVNVLVLESDLGNRELVQSWARALRYGGTLVVLAPALFCGQELALLTGRDDLWECLDLEGSSWIERRQGTREVEYSPLRLRRVLKEAGLRLTDMRLVFLEGLSSREQSRTAYGLDDDDLLVYEQLVTAVRQHEDGHTARG
jgi:SAM-dependent methyltransferase